jgi:hypothetical protein
MPVYDFDDQLLRGERGEAFLDAFFEARGHYIQKATLGQQRLGIDRVFLKDDKVIQVEYKTDLIAHRSGRMFIETISRDTDGKQGWALTSRADMLVYFVPGTKTVYVVTPEALREYLPVWQEAYPTRSARNVDYATHGVLVPVEVFEQVVTQIFHLPPDAFDHLRRPE